MKNNLVKYSLASLIVIPMLSSTLSFAGNGPGTGNQQAGVCPSVTSGTQVSVEDAASLSFMREEEKLARDVYQTLAAQWQTQIFTNIANSEQVHMDQVKCLLDAYGLPDSATSEVGSFNNLELQTLYHELVARGAISLSEALRTGALVEEVDIEDLNQGLNTIQVPEIRLVYENLRQGSESHLKAFVGTLEQLGETYAAQLLDTKEVDTILMPLSQPAVFDLDTQTLLIPELHLSQGGELLPSEGAYQLELHLNEAGDTLQVINLQKLEK